jgi:hypothetical protein
MSLFTRFIALLLVGGLAMMAGAGAAAAQTVVGVTATEIKIGNTNPYSGPASAYGAIGKAIGAYFDKVSDSRNGVQIGYGGFLFDSSSQRIALPSRLGALTVPCAFTGADLTRRAPEIDCCTQVEEAPIQQRTRTEEPGEWPCCRYPTCPDSAPHRRGSCGEERE